MGIQRGLRSLAVSGAVLAFTAGAFGQTRPTPVNIGGEHGSHYSNAQVISAISSTGPGTPNIVGVNPVGGHYQLAVNSASVAGFPTNGGDYLAISSGDAREIHTAWYAAYAGGGSYYDSNYGGILYDVGGVDLDIALPAGAQQIEFDLIFVGHDYNPFEDPIQIFLNSSLVARYSTSTELGSFGGGLGYGPLRHVVVNVSAYAGQTVTLRLQSSDLYDTTLDGGAMVDNLFVYPTNQPPVANAGSDQTVECAGSLTSVTLNGLGSTDPDGDSLTYSWAISGSPIASGPTPTVTLPHGTSAIDLTVSDGKGGSATDQVVVNVVDTTPPTLTLNGANPLTLTRPTSYTEPGAVATDICDPSPVLSISGTVDTAVPGSYTVTYTAKDADGNTTTATRTVVVLNRNPDCAAASPSIAEIWPANHKMVNVSILGVVDPDGDPVSITITKIMQDEPINGLGDGDTGPDGAGIGTPTAQVRAERAGTPKVPGNGRVYHIYFTATDPFGGKCEDGHVTVCVPHDQGKGKLCVDDGPKYNSTGGAAKPTAGGLALAEDAASIPVPEAVPTAFGLESNYPNPFNPSTTIRYALPEGADVRLVVYNILGQSVRTLVDGSQSAGRYSVVWDGRDAIGRQVASGLYIYRLQAGSFIATQKMLLAK